MKKYIAPVLGRRGNIMKIPAAEVMLFKAGLKFIPKKDLYAFLVQYAEASGSEYLAKILDETLRSVYYPSKPKPKITIESFIQSTITEAEEEERKNHFRSPKMLEVSTNILVKELDRNSCSQMPKKKAAWFCIQIFNILSKNHRDTDVFKSSLLKDCGKALGREELEDILDDSENLIKDIKIRSEVLNSLALGFIEYNGAYATMVSYLNDPISRVDMRTPWPEILKNLEETVGLVQADDPMSLYRAKAIFMKACDNPGEDQAVQVVKQTRPDLVEKFL